MEREDFNDETFFLLSKGVEKNDPQIAAKIKSLLKSSDDPSQMRYLEGLLMMLGETPGELEDPPDFEDDPEEYWEEY